LGPDSQLDEFYEHAAHHGKLHLAHVLRLPVLTVRIVDLVKLGDALDNVGHLVAEPVGNLPARGRLVFLARGDVWSRIAPERR